MLGEAAHPFQIHHGASQGASFSGLPVAGASTISKPNLTPVTPPPSFGNMNTSVQAGSAFQGMNVQPGFGTQPAVAYGQAQSFIPPSQNPVPFNQPVSPAGLFSQCCDRTETVNVYVSSALHFESPASHFGQVNLNNLLTRLISTGLIQPTQTAPTQPSKTQPVAERQEKEDVPKFPDLTGFVREDMKKRYNSVVTKLYTGQQCSSCGVRFSSSGTDKYKDHLDRHYRQNRSTKDTSKKDTHRRWCCSVQCCEICREQFDMYWEDEREQWRLKNAIRADGKTYHPSCYEDYKNTW
ncbi:hypothetical protein AAFF_G00089140 [Aldrovandia affinis]|uniref:Pcf11 C-terminal domain-containing protein n=1 Tax=Aldrovandia affinis TaxID=143900 RepID=A0AAD7WCF0_9TELE|nr:hypothetical protein AAFF_G00089140 [Aldrovandia affinis]